MRYLNKNTATWGCCAAPAGRVRSAGTNPRTRHLRNQFLENRHRDAEAAIVSVYDRTQNLWDGNIIALNVQSDEAVSVTNNDQYDEFDRNNILADNNRVEQYWDRNYNGIHRANDILSRVPGIADGTFSAEARERILGEAYFMRAYFYFNLVRLYGGVPWLRFPILRSRRILPFPGPIRSKCTGRSSGTWKKPKDGCRKVMLPLSRPGAGLPSAPPKRCWPGCTCTARSIRKW